MKKILAIAFFAHSLLTVNADIRLPNLVSSNMVLQQKATVKIWGWADPAEKIFVTTSWNNQTDSAIASRGAKWEMSIQTPKAGGPYTITLKGRNTILLNNVLIGEVWICSGQSNMEMNYNWGLPDVKEELSTCSNSNIRFFSVPKSTSIYPQDNCDGSWVSCDSNTLKSFSAVGYFFGKKINSSLNVPVGLISANWGGTPAEVWAEETAVTNDAVLKEAAAKLQPFDWWPYTPGASFNAMIAPVTNYTIAGALWYQGESNTAAPDSYAKLLTALIGSWRKAWKKDFPFYYVQIAPFAYDNKFTSAIVREQQTKAMAVPNVGMVVITDLVDNIKDIHPKNKHDVGYRLAAWALAETYHQTGITYKNPVFQSTEIKKENIIISFANAPTGLTVKEKVITELYIAGVDKVFYPASSTIENNRLVVFSKMVKQPVAVRFGYSSTAMPNLFSKEGLPVNPFRTDNWELNRSEK
ncbi:MAG: sialate O-acetylesterase [Chitinophagaceae bacterium]|nr:sialate O-acetylesterase [Chitinophagaceae bacterium]